MRVLTITYTLVFALIAASDALGPAGTGEPVEATSGEEAP